MKRNIVILGLNFLLLLTALDVSANAHVENKNDIHWPSYTFKVNNPLSVSRDDLVCLAQASLPFTISSKNAYVVEVSGEIVDSQVLYFFNDNDTIGLAFISPFKAHETKIAKVFISDNQNIETRLENKTYAELQVRVGGVFKKDKLTGGDYVPVNHYQLPNEHQVGNKLFKYEGLGWESEEIAYRYYFDHRGAIDIFGKQKSGLFLKEVGIDGDDYHVLDDWGMDILKVGPSLGLGGIGAWHNKTLIGANKFDDLSAQIENKALRSSITLNYKNWQIAEKTSDLSYQLSISAHSPHTRIKVATSNSDISLATGIVKHGVETIKKVSTKGEWSYIATWGHQSLSNDNLGMAIFVKTDQLKEFNQNQHNEIAIFNVSKEPVYYYLSANWSRSPNGTKNKKDFIEFLDSSLAQFNYPVSVLKN
jgi:hypothetical protein